MVKVETWSKMTTTMRLSGTRKKFITVARAENMYKILHTLHVNNLKLSPADRIDTFQPTCDVPDSAFLTTSGIVVTLIE